MADDEDTEPWAAPRRGPVRIFASRVIGERAPEPNPVEVPRYPKPHPVPPREVLEAAMAEADERLAREHPPPPRRQPVTVSVLPRVAIGLCHDCGRAVTGERRYCGPCLAGHRV